MNQKHNANPDIPEILEQALWELLISGKSYKEYELLTTLSAQGFEQFTPSLNPLELFRAHFLLFHILYRLQDKWSQEHQVSLAIHSLEIRLFHLGNRVDTNVACLADFGETPLEVKAYYLDYVEFIKTQEEDVLALLDNFWQSFGDLPSISDNSLSIEEAITILQIDSQPNSEIINQQFRKLSQIHHPDKGGDAELFRQLCHARDILKRMF